MSKQAARLRCACHNQIVIAGPDFFENLIDHDAMSEMHFSRDAQSVEFEEIRASGTLRLRLNQSVGTLLR